MKKANNQTRKEGTPKAKRVHAPTMSFIEMLENEETRKMIEAIEWGSSDPELQDQLEEALWIATGWVWEN